MLAEGVASLLCADTFVIVYLNACDSRLFKQLTRLKRSMRQTGSWVCWGRHSSESPSSTLFDKRSLLLIFAGHVPVADEVRVLRAGTRNAADPAAAAQRALAQTSAAGMITAPVLSSALDRFLAYQRERLVHLEVRSCAPRDPVVLKACTLLIVLIEERLVRFEVSCCAL